ncbi:MAG TPA: LapA family protein [Bacillota bacterium]|nr:LapA family protein [Bacillota bacterium]
MGSLLLILGLLFSLLVAAIAIVNHNLVPVNYLLGTSEVPLILLILGSAACGALVMGLFSIFRGVRTAFKVREGRRRYEELERRARELELDKAALETRLQLLEARLEELESQPEQQGAAILPEEEETGQEPV